jgi:Zn-dependent peptidase ImmA (M78 family)
LKIEFNIGRLQYLLKLYRVSAEELLAVASEGLKTRIAREDVFETNEIKISHLKRIDKVFNRGLHFYLDPKSIEPSKDASIFFRKKSFNSELNFGAKKIVNQFEEFKLSLSAIAELSDLKLPRTVSGYSVSDNPKKVASEVRSLLYPLAFEKDQKEFLKQLIKKLAEKNILVFEFVETWNKKHKANIDGFYLEPNVIVLKRQQRSFRREIFTLSHELGHYLLEKEEIEQLDDSYLAKKGLSKIERWCNDFAYYFLAGPYSDHIDELDVASAANDYHFDALAIISKNTHLSQLALFTRLLFQKKISQKSYSNVKNELAEQFRDKLKAESKQRELDKERGIKPGGSTPKPINSPLLVSTIQTAFYEGVIGEMEVCKRLNIKPDKLSQYV